MGSRALMGCKLHPGWMKPFLNAISHGYNEKNAANMAGVGTNVIRQRFESDSEFRQKYEETSAKAKPRYGRRA